MRGLFVVGMMLSTQAVATDNRYELLLGAVYARTEICLEYNLINKRQHDFINSKFEKAFTEAATRSKLTINPEQVDKDTDQLKSYIHYRYDNLAEFRPKCYWILEDAEYIK